MDIEIAPNWGELSAQHQKPGWVRFEARVPVRVGFDLHVALAGKELELFFLHLFKETFLKSCQDVRHSV